MVAPGTGQTALLAKTPGPAPAFCPTDVTVIVFDAKPKMRLKNAGWVFRIWTVISKGVLLTLNETVTPLEYPHELAMEVARVRAVFCAPAEAARSGRPAMTAASAAACMC